MRFDRLASLVDCSTASIHAPTRGWSERTGSIAPARSTFRALGIAAGLVLVAPSVRAHAAEPTASEPSRAEAAAEVLRVEVAPGIDDAALLPGWIAERHSELQEALRGPQGGPGPWIDVEITGSTYDYRVSVTAVRDGQPLGPRGEPTRCECTIEELLALVDVGIAAASEQLREPASSEPPPTIAPPEAPPPASPPPEPSTPSRPLPTIDARRPLGLLGRAGIGTGAAGDGLATAGIVLALRPKEIRGMPGRTEIRDFRAPGIGLAVTGGALLAAGVAMLVVDRVAPRGRGAALALALGPGVSGLSLAGRF